MKKHMKRSALSLALVLVLLLGLLPAAGLAADWPYDATNYVYKATLMADCPGVYTVKPAVPESGEKRSTEA